MAWKTFGSPQCAGWKSNGVCVGSRLTPSDLMKCEAAGKISACQDPLGKGIEVRSGKTVPTVLLSITESKIRSTRALLSDVRPSLYCGWPKCTHVEDSNNLLRQMLTQRA